MRLSLLLSVAAMTLAACGHGDSHAGPDLDVGPALIDSVTVQIAPSVPVQVFGRITGVVGDGCSTLLPIEQRRSGSLITVEVLRERPRHAVCTQIARLFDETIRLSGDFPAGEYRLRVNDVERQFVVD